MAGFQIIFIIGILLAIIVGILVYLPIIKSIKRNTKNPELLKRKAYEIYFRYSIDWLKKYWLAGIGLIIFLVGFFIVLYYQPIDSRTRIIYEALLIIFMILILFFMLRKKHGFVTEGLLYRLIKESKNEQEAQDFYLQMIIAAAILVIIAVILILFPNLANFLIGK